MRNVSHTVCWDMYLLHDHMQIRFNTEVKTFYINGLQTLLHSKIFLFESIPFIIIFTSSIVKFLKRHVYTLFPFPQLLSSFWPMKLGSCFHQDHNVQFKSNLHTSRSSYQSLSIIDYSIVLEPVLPISLRTPVLISFSSADCSFITLCEISYPFPRFWMSMCSGHNIVSAYIYISIF